MGSSRSILTSKGTFSVHDIVLVLVLVHIFLALSSAESRSWSNSVADSTVLGSSPWLGRLADGGQKSSRRALLQIDDVVAEGGDGNDIADQLLSSRQTVINVNQNGTGDYTTVQEAVDAVPEDNSQRVVIRIFSGTYREKLHIPSSKPFITFRGVGTSAPVLTWHDNATTAGSTWKSSSVSIDAANFIARKIVFQNTAPAPPPGAVGGQAIALRIGGDMAAFYGCSFLGAQDTLCDWMGRHYFENCFIQGSIDFIFGNGKSLYEGCTIKSIAETSGSTTAHYRQTSEDTSGYSFVNCDIIGTGNIMLGRAWGPYARVVFSMTTMSDIIDPKGWSDWNNSTNDQTVYFGEYNNFGAGANVTERVPFAQAITEGEAQQFLTTTWIDGADWLPT